MGGRVQQLSRREIGMLPEGCQAYFLCAQNMVFPYVGVPMASAGGLVTMPGHEFCQTFS